MNAAMAVSTILYIIIIFGMLALMPYKDYGVTGNPLFNALVFAKAPVAVEYAINIVAIIATFTVTVSLIVAGFYGGDATSIETGTNSGYFIMVQPVKKSSILMGRYLGAFILAAATLLIEFVAVGGMSQYIFNGYNSINYWQDKNKCNYGK